MPKIDINLTHVLEIDLVELPELGDLPGVILSSF
jgi:hypothetical protein